MTTRLISRGKIFGFANATLPLRLLLSGKYLLPARSPNYRKMYKTGGVFSAVFVFL
jgi:hypothetical protein